MKLPEPVKVGVHHVKFTEGNPGKGNQGTYDAGKSEAVVSTKDQTPLNTADVVLHECLHAIIRQSGLYHFFENNDELEEAFVALFTPHLLAFILDNPKLYEWFRNAASQ